jgi:hypothetical protein
MEVWLFINPGHATQDLAEAHEEAERLTGEKAALGESVKQLANKVRTAWRAAVLSRACLALEVLNALHR